jgi:predicted restriction endonuclease
VPTEKNFCPYRDAVSILDEWFSAHSDEQGLRDKLTVSGLSSALKAEKRAELLEKLAGVADVHFETELKIGRGGKNGSQA